VQSAFVIVVVVVGAVGVLGAVATLLTSRQTWESLGRDRLLMESELRGRRPRASGGHARAAPLPAPGMTGDDAELRDEVRALVIARNHRRARHGLQALDVESEIERELTRLP
jgi:hypothetical protein